MRFVAPLRTSSSDRDPACRQLSVQRDQLVGPSRSCKKLHQVYPDIGPSRRADAVPQCSALIVGRDKAVPLPELQVDYPILLNPGRHVERKFFAQIEY
jgi:hypothetical protein